MSLPALGLLLPFLLLASGCGESPQPQVEGAPSSERPIPVEVVRIEPESVGLTTEVVGTVGPWSEVSVPARVGGVVERVFAEKGERVRKGQPLLRLDTRDLRLALQEATSQLERGRAELRKLEHLTRAQELEVKRRGVEVRRAEREEARARFERIRTLLRQGVVAREEYDRAERSLKVAEAALRMAQEELALAREGARPEELAAARAEVRRLEAVRAKRRVDLADATVRSPLGAVVVERRVEVGEQVQAGAPVARLAELGRVKVRLHVAEGKVVKLRRGEEIPFTLDALPGRRFSGRIHFIGPLADPTTRTFPLELATENRDGVLRGGMVARAQLTLERYEDALFLPADALVERGGRRGAFVVRGGRAHFRPLELGRRHRDRLLILSGLSAGEVVVVQGGEGLRSGSPVEVSRR